MFIFIMSVFAIKLFAVTVYLARQVNAVAGTPARANPLDDPEHPMNSDRY